MENVIITNEKKLNLTISKMIKDGESKIHILSDFDKTLTKAFVNGQKAHTVIAQLREGKFLSKDYSKKAFALFDIYHPIELDNKISIKEKNEKMYEWWKKHFDLIIETGMNKRVIDEVVDKMKMHFRDGAFQLFDYLYEKNIPLIIMSAAPGDLIEKYLKSADKLYSNISIIANMFIWNKEGKAIGIKEPIIHSLNKKEIEIKDLPIHEELLKRKNVILLGDNIEDTDMIEGFKYDNLIKIGFLNENVEDNLEAFKKNYDIVILNDSDMSYVNEVLRKIITCGNL